MYTEPVTHWQSALQVFKKHETATNGIHKECHFLFTFLDTYSRKQVSISEMVSSATKEKVEKNRKTLMPLIETIKICNKFGTPLRGHRDDYSYHQDVGELSGKTGNFIELLNFRVRAGDKVLEEHMRTSPKTATYMSSTSQNSIIKSIGDAMTDDIVCEIKKARFYSIMADEVNDISGQEQMSFVIRYLNSNCVLKEDFLSFIHCENGLSGKALAAQILEKICSLC